MASSIDVILPVYNAERTILSAVDSILHQSVTEYRVIIINDGSTDRSGEIISSISANDPRVVVISQPNSGIVEALNAGLTESSADLIARHDADDIANFDRLEIQRRYLDEHPDCAAVSGGVRHIDGGGKVTGSYFPPSPDTADPNWAHSKEPYLIHPFLMVRRESILSVGGYRHVHHAEDADLYWRLTDVGKLHNLDVILGDYRIHGHSISGSSVLNARIMAIHSQLSAISASRRRRGDQDLHFPGDTLRQYEAARSIDGMYELATAQLVTSERRFLEIAVASKLLELASYRPFSLEVEDCRFIRRAFGRRRSLLSSENRAEVRRSIARSGARLARKGKGREALALLPASVIPSACARLGYGVLVGGLARAI
jgi:glycosyltransferase involved in cell wall biosynthesis